MPFIANNGQVDEQVRFYAKTFGGTVFVTKDGEIVYALPKSGDVEDGETHRKAAKCAKERSEKHISHKDTKNTEEMIEGGMDKPCLSVLRATTGHTAECRLGEACPELCRRAERTQQIGSNGLNPLNRQAGSGLQPEPLNLLNTGVCVIDTISKGINSGVQVANLNPQGEDTDKQGLSMPPNSNSNVLPANDNPQSKIQNLSSTKIGDQKSEARGVALKEQLVGGKIGEINGGSQSVTTVSYFKGNDPSKWKSSISTYEVVDMGEVYEGIGLKLKAYGNNVEKLFTVKPGADPEQIRISLSGIQSPENPPPTPR